VITARQVNDFLCDENYLAAVEGAREHRLLFITDLSETRVSAFLGWMFRPHEAHGLGDQVLRELLQNAWRQVNSGDWDGPSWEELGLSEWTPAKVSTRSFRDLCVETEYRFGRSEKGGDRNRPVDVFLISRTNRLLVLIENKFGTAVHSDQLRAYREQAEKSFPEYTRLQIYLDPNAENFPDDKPNWIPLRYDWLIEIIAARERTRLLSQRASDALLQVRDYLEQDSVTLAGVDSRQLEALVSGHVALLEEMRRLSKAGRNGALLMGNKELNSESEILLVEYHQRQRFWDAVFEQMDHLPLLNALAPDIGPTETLKLNKRLQFRSALWPVLHDPGVPTDAAWSIRLAAWKPEEDGGLYSIRSLIDFNTIHILKEAVPPFTPERERTIRRIAADLRLFGRKASAEDSWIRLMEKKRLPARDAASALREEIERINNAFRKEGLLK
jgi:hypothetical protein